MRYPQAPAMDISSEEIKAAFGRVCATKPVESLYGSVYQVLFLPSQLDTPVSATHYTAFCPFTGIMGRGTFRPSAGSSLILSSSPAQYLGARTDLAESIGSTMAQAYKAWLSEASLVLGLDIRSLLTSDVLANEELASRKLGVGEIMAPSKNTLVPVFVIDVLQCDQEVVICPYKSEVGTADKNTNTPVYSCDGKEMKVPGFITDHRVKCTRLSRLPTASATSTTIITATTVTATLV